MKIDRRQILLGAGAALTLTGCNRAQPRKQGDIAVGGGDKKTVARAFRGIEPDWNLGDDPWESFEHEVLDEAPLPTATFAADYIAVLHLEVSASPFILKSWRAHFPVDGAKPIFDRVVEVIRYLNKIDSGATRPTYIPQQNVVSGLKGFGFTRPHHLIIYIKNPGVFYDQNYPVWFGGKLAERWNGSYLAAPNRSFFNAKPPRSDSRIPSAPDSESDRFLYIQNYFYTADEGPDERQPSNRRKIGSEDLKYSLNINAAIRSSDGLGIPLVIDPDTGNMGGGGDGALP